MNVVCTPVRARGFTLVELLVALTLLAGVSALGFQAMDLGAKHWLLQSHVALRSDEIFSTQRFLRRVLADAQPVTLRKNGQEVLGFEGSADELIWMARFPDNDGALAWLRIARIRSGASGERSDLVLERWRPELQQGDLGRDVSLSMRERFVLLADAGDFQLFYGREARPVDMQDEWRGESVLPAVVAVRLGAARQAWPELYVRLHGTEI